MKAVALVVILLVGLVVAVASTPGPSGAAPAVQGCPACHGAAGKEPGLDALAKKIKNHPATAATAVAQCIICHRAGPAPPPFRTVLHKKHLPSKKFTATYKGTCTSCHKVDTATGTITVYGLEK